MDRPHLYRNGGLLPTNGQEWANLRQASQKPLALHSFIGIKVVRFYGKIYLTFQSNQILDNFIPMISTACDDFIDSLKSSAMSGELITEDFLEDLKRLFMEITGIVTTGQRLGSLNTG